MQDVKNARHGMRRFTICEMIILMDCTTPGALEKQFLIHPDQAQTRYREDY